VTFPLQDVDLPSIDGYPLYELSSGGGGKDNNSQQGKLPAFMLLGSESLFDCIQSSNPSAINMIANTMPYFWSAMFVQIPMVINTWEFLEATEAAWDQLDGKGSRLDAVEKVGE